MRHRLPLRSVSHRLAAWRSTWVLMYYLLAGHWAPATLPGGCRAGLPRVSIDTRPGLGLPYRRIRPMTAEVRTKPQVAVMNAVHDLPVLVARDKGYFKDEGLDLEFVTTPGMAQVDHLALRQVRLGVRPAARLGLQRGRHRPVPHVRVGHHEARGRGRSAGRCAAARSWRSAPRCRSSPSWWRATRRSTSPRC